MEQLAQAAAAGLTEGTLSSLLEQQAHLLGPQQPCPDCGRPCQVEREQRLVKLRSGPLLSSEPICHCPGCRRDFFPSTAPASPGHARV
jgi:hypothetical protein